MRENKITKDIVLAFQKGDEEAFIKIYEHYHKKIYFIAYYYFNDKEFAYDIVQNTFTQVHKNREKLKAPEAFHVWIHKIAYSECRNASRKKQLPITDLGDVMQIEDFTDSNFTDELDEHTKMFIYETILTSINQLSEQNRYIAMMRFCEELSIQEIASVMRIPEGTVKSRLNRIKKELKNSLEQKGVTPTILHGTAIPTAMLVAAYAFSKQHIQVDFSAIDVLAKAKASVSTTLLLSKKAFLASMIVVSVGFFAFIGTQQEESKELKEKKEIPQSILAQEDSCKIERVEYETTPTNQAININVITTSSAYDQIQINNKDIKEVYENGTYHITLLKAGKLLDERYITIENIDKEHPDLLSTKQENSQFTLQLFENGSGINAEKIEYYSNGVLSNAFTYNDIVKTIVFHCDEGSNNYFLVYDYAGNVRNIEVNSILE